MGLLPFLSFLFVVSALCYPPTVRGNAELRALMEMKASLDPGNTILTSWTFSGDPCGGSFDGVACNEKGQVANVSLQGKGLTGKLSPAVAGLKQLTGLYLHYNALYGGIPREISNLTELSDLYLNVNNLSGNIPPELGDIATLQVLQLCYNKFSGSIPTKLGSLKKLSVLALQSNRLTGAIPASLGDLGSLARLDLSFNALFGSIPTKLADAPMLQILDLRNNSLSGNVPPALKRLDGGFQFENNLGLCGSNYSSLRSCGSLDERYPNTPQSYGDKASNVSTKDIPETANLNLNCTRTQCSNSKNAPRTSIIIAAIVSALALSAIGLLIFARYRKTKQKPENTLAISDQNQAQKSCKKIGSPLISLEYSSGWDPLAEDRRFGQELLQRFIFNLEEIESATQYFSVKKLMGKSGFSATYKGIMRDGSVVAVKSISKGSCKSEEGEFLRGLRVLTSLRHENLVNLRGFCCSRSRGECFLVYDFVPNGNLLGCLDTIDGDARVLDWSTRVSIINGVAKGIEYLHRHKVNKPPLIHQNISARNVLIDNRFQPLLSDSGLHKLLTNDTIFSSLKASAAMGYLAPEYATTGRFTEKNDVYALGVLIFQIISGKSKLHGSIRASAELCKFDEFIDLNLHGKFSEDEAMKISKIALICTHELPEQRPTAELIVHELGMLANI